MFELTKEEYAALRCKNSTIKSNGRPKDNRRKILFDCH